MTEGISKEEKQIWLPVVGYEKYYEVSNSGNVRKLSGEILSQCNNEHGYKLVRLSNPRSMARVHRMVAKAFVDNPCEYDVVNHIDHCRTNNNHNNLEWCTQKHNLNHAEEHGRMKRNNRLGKMSPTSKVTHGTVSAIKERYSKGILSYRDIAREYKISTRTVGRIINNTYCLHLLPMPPAEQPDASPDAPSNPQAQDI